MIRERLGQADAQRGFILDGFPRNLPQAGALTQLLQQLDQPLDAVVLMEVNPGELVRRISGRRTCKDCGRVFNVFTSPPPAGELPEDGREHNLFQREDDKEATVAHRLKVYEDKTKPLVEFYRTQDLLRTINAEGELDEVSARLGAALHVAVVPASAPPRAPKKRTRRRSAHRPAARASATRVAVRRRPHPKPAPAKRKTAAKRKSSKTKATSRAAPSKARGKRKTIARKSPRRHR